MANTWKPFRVSNSIWADGDLRSVSYSESSVRLKWTDYVKSEVIVVFEGVQSFQIDFAAIEASSSQLDDARSKTVNDLTTVEIFMEARLVLSITFTKAKERFEN